MNMFIEQKSGASSNNHLNLSVKYDWGQEINTTANLTNCCAIGIISQSSMSLINHQTHQVFYQTYTCKKLLSNEIQQ